MSQYTDEDVRAVGLAIDATMPLHGGEDEQIDYAARAVLDAVAPAIAARALEDAADRLDAAKPSQMFALGWTAAAMAVRAVANLTGSGRI